MITNNVSGIDCETSLVSFSIIRKNSKKFVFSSNQIMEMYKDNLKRHGYYLESFRDALGDEFFMFTFEDNTKTIEKFLKNSKSSLITPFLHEKTTKNQPEEILWVDFLFLLIKIVKHEKLCGRRLS